MEVILTKKADKQLLKLPIQAQVKIEKTITEIEQADTLQDIHNMAPIKNHSSLYRIKRPPYRVIVELDGNTLIIKSIVKRDEGTYKKL